MRNQMQGESKSRQSEQKLAMLGHELYSVLNGIQGMTELLGGTGLNGEQRQLLEATKLSVRQMHWLIESIDPNRRAPVFPIPARRSSLDGRVLLEQAVRCHARAAKMNNNLLLLILDPLLSPRWISDACLLRQVIDNLLGNAIKFTQSGQVVLEARRPAAGQGMHTGLELLIRDTGIGFSQAAAGRIFKPFEQAGPGINRVYGGSGLGLYICRRTVTRLQGQLDCSSRAGQGSSFRVLLPDVIDSGSSEEPGRKSSLLSCMTCLVTLPAEFGRSIEALLTRMGIAVESGPNEQRPCPESGFVMEISQAHRYGEDAPLEHSLLFAPAPIMSDTGPLPVDRQLQAPFLESTLGPLLMEMALEWRMCQQTSV
jgi:hypothetical protein